MATVPYRRPVWEQAAHDADLTLVLPGRVPMFFRRIRAGSFRMGARGGFPEEEPVHRVVLPHDFYLGTFVVTQEQYAAVARQCPALKREPDPSYFKGPRRPVESVSWVAAAAFCDWLSRWNGLPREIALARLPTEAEWEYACRCGSDTDYYNGDGEAALAEVGWFDGNSNNETHPVDELSEDHPFKLFGLHGKVWEWCQDVFDPNAYRKRADDWPARVWTLEDAGDEAHHRTDEDRAAREHRSRVLRGGSWGDSAGLCRSASRIRGRLDFRLWVVGYRVCLVPDPQKPERGALTEPTAAAELATGEGGRGTRPQSDGAGGAASGVPFPAKRRKSFENRVP